MGRGSIPHKPHNENKKLIVHYPPGFRSKQYYYHDVLNFDREDGSFEGDQLGAADDPRTDVLPWSRSTRGDDQILLERRKFMASWPSHQTPGGCLGPIQKFL